MHRALFCISISTACGIHALAADLDLRKQYRADIAELIRTHNPKLAQDAPGLAKALDDAVAQLEEEAPRVFDGSPKVVPTSKKLQAVYDRALNVCGELPRSEWWLFYLDRWKQNRLGPAQKILLQRFLEARTEKTEEERRERERKKG